MTLSFTAAAFVYYTVVYTQRITLHISQCVTARSRDDETQHGHRNAKRNPRWSSQVSFQMAHSKRDLNFGHQDFDLHFDEHFECRLLGNGLYTQCIQLTLAECGTLSVLH